MKKALIILFGLFNIQITTSQIVITEVYYDTPFLENIYHYFQNGLENPNPYYHHLGEYIELYNYSTEDIPLKKWAITDNVTRYEFPADAVIKKGEFIVVAYKQSGHSNYFTTFFPTTTGQESKIFYQDKMMLRNRSEEIKLHMGEIRGVDCKNKIIQRIVWGVSTGGIETLLNNAWNSSATISSSPDYMESESIHLNDIAQENAFIFLPASPLSSHYIPPAKDLEDIQSVQEALNNVLTDFTWDHYALAILNNTCPDDIDIIEQNDANQYMENGKCFTYDNSGNSKTAVDCITPDEDEDDNNTTIEYTASEIEDFSSLIVLSPNPTSSTLTASWSGNVLGKITEMQVGNTIGVNINVTPIYPMQDNVLITLTSQPTGIYIVKFILNTGQFISKNVIKN
jgi:hypothetical protein